MRIKTNKLLSEECYAAWKGMESIREERNRNIRYKNGVHWAELVNDPENSNSMIKEEELILREGRIPLKYNFISQMIRNILGQTIRNPSQSVVHSRCRNNQQLSEMLTNTLQSSLTENQHTVLDIEVCEELLLAGIACTKVRYGLNDIKNRGEGMLSNINFNNLFFNNDITDSRMRNLNMVGELHDMSLDEIVMNFAESPQHENQLKKIFNETQSSSSISDYNGFNKSEKIKLFNYSQKSNNYRIIEVWQKSGKWVKEVHDKEKGVLYTQPTNRKNSINKEVNEVFKYYWTVTFLTPDGYVLKSMETPFEHKSHPYVFATLPIINGEIRSMLSDLIDIQRYINRLIIMIDFIIASSAKGVLMIPENAIPDGYTVNDFTKEYVKTNGVIVYKPNPTREVPFQITANSTNVGAWDMLNLQMQLMQQVSGMSGAIQGMSTGGMVGASLYSQQSENSQLNFQSLFETLRAFKHSRDEKLLKTILQYYKEQRVIGLCDGCRSGEREFLSFDPNKIDDLIDFHITISQSINTPVYRGLYEDILVDMLKSDFIDIKMYLQNCSLPFADKLLSQIEQKEQHEQLEQKEQKEQKENIINKAAATTADGLIPTI